MDKFISAFIYSLVIFGTFNLPGCATIEKVKTGVFGDRIESLRDQVGEVRDLLDAVMSDDELSKIRRDLRKLDDIDLDKLGTDDSRLWQAYTQVREVVQHHYIIKNEKIPSVFKKFNKTAEKIHHEMPVVVKTVQDARRLVWVYKVLVL